MSNFYSASHKVLAPHKRHKGRDEGFTVGGRVRNQVENRRICVCENNVCIREACVERADELFNVGVELKYPLVYSL